MAGNGKLYSSSIFASLVRFLILCDLSLCVLSFQCKSQQNEPVDWFIVYKLPFSIPPKDSFFYMDVKSKSWSLSDKSLNDHGQAVYNTLDLIYKKSENASTGTSVEDFMYLMYNDQIPKIRIDPGKKSMPRSNEQFGHTKGVIGFDSKSGFWLVHSTPGFPPIRSHGYSYPIKTYAQSFLCVSMETGQHADELGQQLLYNHPNIYDHSLPAFFASKFPKMADAVNGGHVKTAPWYRETSLTSLSGTKFVSFAKYAYYNSDIYKDWLAPRFGDNLLVETWQSGRGTKLCSNCTGQYWVYNVENIEFQSESITFKGTQDHSKWMVTNTSRNTWTCIGDMNRMESQLKRSGGMVCFQDTSVWEHFRQIIASFHVCNPLNGCVKS